MKKYSDTSHKEMCDACEACDPGVGVIIDEFDRLVRLGPQTDVSGALRLPIGLAEFHREHGVRMVRSMNAARRTLDQNESNKSLSPVQSV